MAGNLGKTGFYEASRWSMVRAVGVPLMVAILVVVAVRPLWMQVVEGKRRLEQVVSTSMDREAALGRLSELRSERIRLEEEKERLTESTTVFYGGEDLLRAVVRLAEESGIAFALMKPSGEPTAARGGGLRVAYELEADCRFVNLQMFVTRLEQSRLPVEVTAVSAVARDNTAGDIRVRISTVAVIAPEGRAAAERSDAHEGESTGGGGIDHG
jgi:hypothetical protein